MKMDLFLDFSFWFLSCWEKFGKRVADTFNYVAFNYV